MFNSEFLQRFLNEVLPGEIDKFRLPSVPGLQERLENLHLELNSAGFDRWGMHPKTLLEVAPVVYWFYKNYFRVETLGIENIPKGRALFIGNHGGQLPLDAVMAGMALFLESQPPKFVRGMVERWVPTVPFVSGLFTRIGAMIGDPENCRDLLVHDQSVLIFPEGVRGSGKLFKDRYQLQRFGTGFVRLALETKSPIVPVAIIGTEECYPGLYNAKTIAKTFHAPYFPVTPFFPWLGFFGMIPLPTKVTVRIGAPIIFEGDPYESEDEVRTKTQQVKDALAQEIKFGLEKRGDDIFWGSAK